MRGEGRGARPSVIRPFVFAQGRHPSFVVLLLCLGYWSLVIAPSLAEELPEQLQMEFGEVLLPEAGPARPPTPPGAAIFGPERQDPFSGIPTQEEVAFSGQAYYQPAGGEALVPTLPGMPQPVEGQPFVPSRGYLSPRDRYAGQEGLLITGTATVAGRLNFVEGNSSAYDSQFLDTRTLDRAASVYVTGRLTGPIYVNGRIDARRYAPSLADYSITYRQSNADLTFGQLQVNVQRNAFVGFTKSIQGIQATGSYGGNGAFELFAASPKGRVRTDRIPGNGTSGPYRLSFSPVREGSERVRLDERDLTQAEYNLDYTTGFFTFENNVVIPPTSVIIVAYEENRPGDLPGLLLGFTTATNVGKIPLGITYISQQLDGALPGEPALSRPFEERFEGNNSVGPFELSRRPVDQSRPIQVLINSIPQIEEEDFQFIPDSGIIQFFDLVPATSTVVVRYFYLDRPAQADASKRLIGLDTGFRFGNASVGISMGRSEGGLLADGTPSPGGNALNVRGTFVALDQRLRVGLGLVDVDPTFSRIESATFQRDRRGTDIDVIYTPSSEARLYFRQSRDRSSRGLSLGAAPNQIGASATGFVFATQRRNFGGTLSYGGWPQIQFDVNQSSSGREGSGQSRLDNFSLSASDQFGRLAIGAAFDRSSRGFQPAADAPEDATPPAARQASGALPRARPWPGLARERPLARGASPQRTITSQARASGRLRIGTASSLSLGYSTNRTEDPTGGGLDSQGNGLDLRLNYLPSQKLTISASRSLAQSRGAVFRLAGGGLSVARVASNPCHPLLGTLGGPAIYQASGDPTVVQASTDDVTSNLSLVYMPGQRLSINLSAGQRRYNATGDIGYEANNESTNLSGGIFYSPSSKLNLGADYTRSLTQYLDRGNVPLTSDSFTLSGNFTPNRRIGMRFGYNLTDAASPFFGASAPGGDGGSGTGLTLLSVSNFASYAMGVIYRMSPKMSLLFDSDLSQNRGGIDNSDRTQASLRLQHALTSLLAVNLGLRYINFRDLSPPAPGGQENRDYRALSVIAELSARF